VLPLTPANNKDMVPLPTSSDADGAMNTIMDMNKELTT
tara:strand:- start:395 stop:508 length:114 start_codon:yes stop_codon:yes gene_type:complete